MMSLRPFHAAYPVSNLASAIQFYTTHLGCSLGRHDRTWVDINFFGHQLVFHLDPNYTHLEIQMA